MRPTPTPPPNSTNCVDTMPTIYTIILTWLIRYVIAFSGGCHTTTYHEDLANAPMYTKNVLILTEVCGSHCACHLDCIQMILVRASWSHIIRRKTRAILCPHASSAYAPVLSWHGDCHGGVICVLHILLSLETAPFYYYLTHLSACPLVLWGLIRK